MTDVTQLVIGRGKLFFELFENNTLAGDGQRYLGNTPGFSLAYSEDAEERYQSIGGVRVLVDRYVTRQAYKGAVVCDEMSSDNVAMWFNAEDVSTLIDAATSTVSEVFTIKRGLYYQVGVTDDTPLGERFLHDVTFKKGTDPIDTDSNIFLGASNGRFQVLDNAPDLASGDALTIRYQRNEARQHLLSKSKKLKGAVTFVAANLVGPQVDYFFPLVYVAPTGTMDLKTDDFQRMTFDFHVAKHPTKDLFYAGTFIKT